MSKRKILDVRLDDYVDFYDVLSLKTPDEVVEAMKYYQKQYAGRDVYFSVETYGYDGGKELTLRERREENDKEFAKRTADEKKERAIKKSAKVLKEAKERAEYERLKKKFKNV
jgi:hypothetical protein